MNNGHWYCSCCNDIKFLPPPAKGSRNDVERCLDCKNNSVMWVPNGRALPGRVSAADAAEMFGEIRKAIQ